MKKGKLFTKLAVFGTCLCAPLLLAGCTKESESKVEFRVQDGYIQVTEDGETWKNLVDIDDLKGEPGQPGQNGVGVDGKQVEFNVSDTHVQWRYVGEADWNDLIALDEIEGEDASVATYTITYDYNTTLDILDYIDNYKISQTVKSNEWVTEMPKLVAGSSDNFLLGWYIKGTDKKVEEYDFIGGSVTLEARWNEEALYGVNCSNFTYNATHGGYECEIDLSKDAVIMPSIYIGANGIKDVVIVDSNYTNISGKHNLTHIKLANNLKVIRRDTFNNTQITDIELPNTIQEIGDRAFKKTNIEKRIKLPENLVYFGLDVFPETCYTTYNNAMYMGTANNPYHILIKGTSPDITSCAINSMTKVIAADAFRGSALTSIVIPDSVVTLSEGVFAGCEDLVELSLGSGLKNINAYIFGHEDLDDDYVSNLKTLHIGKGVTYGLFGYLLDNMALTSIIVEEGNPIYRVENGYLIKTLDNIVVLTKAILGKTSDIPQDVTAIGFAAFKNVETLGGIEIHDNITFIDTNAFAGCSHLVSLYIPASVTSIGYAIVDGCTTLQSITVDKDNENYFSYNNCIIEKDTALTIIAGCQNSIIPTSIDGYGTVTSIANYAFGSIKFVTEYTSVSGLKFVRMEINDMSLVGDHTFDNLSSCTTIVINNEDVANSDELLNKCNVGDADGSNDFITTIYVKTSFTELASSITDNFTKQETSDKNGYDMYVRNVTE